MQSAHKTLIHYDAERRRLWIAGQRCHHGATGAIIAGIAAAKVVAPRIGVSTVALLAAGTMLMADDWHDRSIWFQRGWQNQP